MSEQARLVTGNYSLPLEDGERVLFQISAPSAAELRSMFMATQMHFFRAGMHSAPPHRPARWFHDVPPVEIPA